MARTKETGALVAGLCLALLAGCSSPGPGRLPYVPDSGVRDEPDSGLGRSNAMPGPPGPTTPAGSDAGTGDATVLANDAGAPVATAMTGVFTIRGDATPVYARELR